jgi:signal transduction histidine kinase
MRIAVVLVILLSACSRFPEAEKGLLTLDGSAPLSVTPLSGEWEFYPNRLFSQIRPEERQFAPVPSLWTSSGLPAQGFAVYRLRIENLPRARLALHIPEMYSSYNVYANGVLIAHSGKVATSAEEARPSFNRQVAELHANSPQIEIAIEVANFHFPRGGIPSVLRLGEYEQIRDFRERGIAESVLLSGAALMLGAYHLLAFLVHRRDPPFLYFGLFCLMLSLRSLLINEQYLVDALPAISWETWQRIEFLNFIALLPCFYHFIRVSYVPGPQGRFARFLNLSLGFCALLVLATPPRIFGLIPVPVYLLIGSAVVHVAMILLSQIRAGDRGARVVFGLFVLLTSIVGVEILIERDILRGLDFVEIPGFLAFLLSQAYVLSLYTERLRKEKDAADFLALQERRRNLRLELALGNERERIVNDLHDHIGAHLTDLSMRAERLRPGTVLDEHEVAGLQGDIRRSLQSLRDTISDNEDLRTMAEDFIHGLQLSLVRRYSRESREMRFHADDATRSRLQRLDAEEVKRALYAVTVEIATNDLKYGHGSSVWTVDCTEDRLSLRMEAATRFAGQADGAIGRKSIRRRLLTVGAELREHTEGGIYFLAFDIPLDTQTEAGS